MACPNLSVITALLLFTFVTAASAFDRVIIDAGHGGKDKGGSSGYVYEKHLALDTAFRLKKMLEQVGLKVTMTRDRDNFIELEDRAKIGNRHRDAIFVSLHYNHTSRSSVSGIETFYYHSKSRALASAIQKRVYTNSKCYNRGVKHAGFHVIKKTTRNPSCLVELGFLSNSWERNRCINGNHRQKLAEGIARGILEYRWATR